MGLGRFVAGVSLAAGVGLATYLTLTQQDPLTWGKKVQRSVQQTAQQLDDVRQAKDQVATNAQQLATALEDGTQTLNAIQTQIDKFQFKVAPRVAVIEETLARLEDRES
ncbi:hypothetical protein [Levilactobacillus acidifarinae]|uniref:Uncharacterized protein n=1 Tax=Levilactobacillus acidifarinae DSM 19394 = JCM 15949 TaxID=1423715 RepID=A0A0R1LPV8_9LACO|nr:hypothetical protein [Levilactobacillus acidifarinae]KRK94865.1 hypothetical protein FD25_GL000843 [Levilactobacillus acidifarinae DSM 19394]GEO70265.1 membrane protein [Levilactobacillus acidifarinae]